MPAKLQGQRPRNIARWAPYCRLGTTERFAFFGQVQAHMGGFYIFTGERVEATKCVVSFASFVSYILLCARGLVTDFVRQSYPDRVPDPGSGEQSGDPHSYTVLSRQHADESLIWNYVYRAL